MAVTPEKRVKILVDAALKKLGADCYRFMPVQTGLGAKTLDYLLCIRGHFVSIETKAPGKQMTAMQETTARTIRAAGGKVFLVDGEETLDQAMAQIALMMEFDSADNATPRRTNPYDNSCDPTWPT